LRNEGHLCNLLIRNKASTSTLYLQLY